MIKIFLHCLFLSIYAFSLTLEIPITQNNSDAQERISNGNINRGSNDLKLGFDGNNEQAIGLHFISVNLANSAIITKAYIQFTVDEVNTGTTNIIVVGEANDDASQYTNTSFNITSRSQTIESVSWSIPVWNSVGDKGTNQRSPDIKDIVEEIRTRAGWVSGNAMAFMLQAGTNCNSSTCQRTADSYNGSSANAPVLVIEYTIPIESNLLVDYRMDECYWLNGAGGVIGDVKDSSTNLIDATSSNTASITQNTATPSVCNYGTFSVEPDMIEVESSSMGNTDHSLSISFWIKSDALFPKWATIISKTETYWWTDGWGFVNRGNTSNQLTFFINKYNRNVTDISIDPSEGWVHIVGTYDKKTIRLYKNGIEVDTRNYSKSINNSTQAVKIAYDGDSRDGILVGSLDEVKIWDRTLDSTEITNIYTNELLANNFDGTQRECTNCGTSVIAQTWSFMGIPANLRSSSKQKVSDVLDEFPLSSYAKGSLADGWILYKRSYSDTDNNSAYAIIPSTDEDLAFGQGYWLFSNSDVNWSINNLNPTDYNSTNTDCVADTCVEIHLETTNKNFDAPDYDPNDGSGKNRINMLSFVGETPVDWADCRIIIDGISYTPTAAGDAGYIDNQVWQYNIGDSNANANGYTTCNDLTPGGCKLEPYKAFWLILHGISKNKTIKLLIPKE